MEYIVRRKILGVFTTILIVSVVFLNVPEVYAGPPRGQGRRAGPGPGNQVGHNVGHRAGPGRGNQAGHRAGPAGGHGGVHGKKHGGHREPSRYYHHGDRYYHRSGWWWVGAATTLAVGSVLASLPRGYAVIYVNGLPYYYYDGLYYKQCPQGYAVVRAPMGAVVTTIPEGHPPVVIDGVSYYAINDAMYMSTPAGYQVVPQIPMAQAAPAQPAPVSTQPMPPVQQIEGTQPAPAAPTKNTINVKIPNSKGGYDYIPLQRKGNGYVGPQGEYYERIPDASQLKVMYGK